MQACASLELGAAVSKPQRSTSGAPRAANAVARRKRRREKPSAGKARARRRIGWSDFIARRQPSGPTGPHNAKFPPVCQPPWSPLLFGRGSTSEACWLARAPGRPRCVLRLGAGRPSHPHLAMAVRQPGLFRATRRRGLPVHRAIHDLAHLCKPPRGARDPRFPPRRGSGPLRLVESKFQLFRVHTSMFRFCRQPTPRGGTNTDHAKNFSGRARSPKRTETWEELAKPVGEHPCRTLEAAPKRR